MIIVSISWDLDVGAQGRAQTRFHFGSSEPGGHRSLIAVGSCLRVSLLWVLASVRH